MTEVASCEDRRYVGEAIICLTRPGEAARFWVHPDSERFRCDCAFDYANRTETSKRTSGCRLYCL